MKTSILPTMALALQVDWLDAYTTAAADVDEHSRAIHMEAVVVGQ